MRPTICVSAKQTSSRTLACVAVGRLAEERSRLADQDDGRVPHQAVTSKDAGRDNARVDRLKINLVLALALEERWGWRLLNGLVASVSGEQRGLAAILIPVGGRRVLRDAGVVFAYALLSYVGSHQLDIRFRTEGKK